MGNADASCKDGNVSCMYPDTGDRFQNVRQKTVHLSRADRHLAMSSTDRVN